MPADKRSALVCGMHLLRKCCPLTDIGGAELVAGWQEHVGVSPVASRVRGHGVGTVRPLGIAPTLGSKLEFAHIGCVGAGRGG